MGMNWRIVSAFGVAACMTMASSVGAEEISECVLEVHQAKFLDGPCNFESGDDGSFTIGVGDTAAQASLYFAYIGIDENDPSLAFGFWNGFPPESKAHDQIGELSRDGACWVSATAKVCAFK